MKSYIDGNNRRNPAGVQSHICGKSTMAKPLLPPDFKEFLRLLNDHKVESLLVGGYVIGHNG